MDDHQPVSAHDYSKTANYGSVANLDNSSFDETKKYLTDEYHKLEHDYDIANKDVSNFNFKKAYDNANEKLSHLNLQPTYNALKNDVKKIPLSDFYATSPQNVALRHKMDGPFFLNWQNPNRQNYQINSKQKSQSNTYWGIIIFIIILLIIIAVWYYLNKQKTKQVVLTNY